MDKVLNVFSLPSVASPAEIVGSTMVVIDVLRASTTIAFALDAGAKEVIPFLEVNETRAAAVQRKDESPVLGGERDGLPIAGFDLGNSPTEYTPESVGGKTVLFTTTNGTRAMMACREAQRVLIGAFVNATAVVERLLDCDRIGLVCAGTGGKVGRDDVLFAGLLVDRLQHRSGMTYKLNAQAITAQVNWTTSFTPPFALGAEPIDPEVLAAALRRSLAGEKLTRVGLEADILTVSQIDRFQRVPEMDPASLRIRLP